MSNYFIQPVDPAEMASRFSNDQALESLPEMDEDWKESHLSEIKTALKSLPEKEADYIRLYYFRNKKQVDIAKIFDVTQAAVSYRIQRGEERLQFLLDMPDLTKHEVYERLKEIFDSKLDAKIFREMYETSCQTEVANQLDLGQGCVRHRFLAGLRGLGESLIEKYHTWISQYREELLPGEIDLMKDKLDDLDRDNSDLDEDEFEDRFGEVVKLFSSVDLSDDHLDKPSHLEEITSIYQVFVRIRHNFNILREVKLPEWSSGPSRKIS